MPKLKSKRPAQAPSFRPRGAVSDRNAALELLTGAKPASDYEALFGPLDRPDRRLRAMRGVLPSIVTVEHAAAPTPDVVFAAIEVLSHGLNETIWEAENATLRVRDVEREIHIAKYAVGELRSKLEDLDTETKGVIERGGLPKPLEPMVPKPSESAAKDEKAQSQKSSIAGREPNITAWIDELSLLQSWLRQTETAFRREYGKDSGGQRTMFTEHGGHPKFQFVRDLLDLFVRCRPETKPTESGSFAKMVRAVFAYATGSDTEKGINPMIRRVLRKWSVLKTLEKKLNELRDEHLRLVRKADASKPGRSRERARGHAAAKKREYDEVYEAWKRALYEYPGFRYFKNMRDKITIN
jgi:hypothetical protein